MLRSCKIPVISIEGISGSVVAYEVTRKNLFDLILYVPVNNFSAMSGRVAWVEPVLGKVAEKDNGTSRYD